MIQLSVRGKPSGFDLAPSNDICAVSSPGCIALYHLNGFGSPRSVIHYEQPQQIRQLKYQRGGQLLLSALRGPTCSLWDPHKPLRPLIGVFGGSGWITDTQWSSSNTNLLGTSSDNGDIQIFDIRVDFKQPSLRLSLNGVTNDIKWCPFNPNMVSTVFMGNTLLLWDIRKESSDIDKKLVYDSVTLKHNIIETSWLHDTKDSAIIIAGTSFGSVEWWNVTNDGGLKFNRESIVQSIVDESSQILPSPIGKGFIATKKVADVDNSNMLSLHGYSRDGIVLGKVYQPPSSQEGNMDDDNYSDSPCIQLALCNESILSMHWGTPGRLIPPSHSGLELLIFTESSKIYPIKIKSEIVKKYFGGINTLSISNDPSKPRSSSNATIGSEDQNLSSNLIYSNNSSVIPPKYSVDDLRHKSLESDTSPSKKALPYQFIPNHYHDRTNLSANDMLALQLQANALMTSQLDDNKLHRVSGSDVFWNQLKDEILHLELSINNGLLSNLYIGRLDQYARQLTLEMKWTSDSNELPKQNDDVQQLVTLIIFFPPKISLQSLPAFTIRPNPASQVALAIVSELNSITKNCFELQSNSSKSSQTPLLTILSLSKDNEKTGFIVEVARTFRNRVMQFWESNQANSRNLTTLSNVSFPSPSQANLNLTNNSSGNVSTSPKLSLLTILQDNNTSATNDNNCDYGVESSSSVVADEQAMTELYALNDIIDQKSYRLPHPVTSGARFGSRGLLALFGEACIDFPDVTCPNAVPLISPQSAFNQQTNAIRPGSPLLKSSNSPRVTAEIKSELEVDVALASKVSLSNKEVLNSVNDKKSNCLDAKLDVWNEIRTYADMLVEKRSLHVWNDSRHQAKGLSTTDSVPTDLYSIRRVTSSNNADELAVDTSDDSFDDMSGTPNNQASPKTHQSDLVHTSTVRSTESQLSLVSLSSAKSSISKQIFPNLITPKAVSSTQPLSISQYHGHNHHNVNEYIPTRLGNQNFQSSDVVIPTDYFEEINSDKLKRSNRTASRGRTLSHDSLFHFNMNFKKEMSADTIIRSGGSSIIVGELKPIKSTATLSSIGNDDLIKDQTTSDAYDTDDGNLQQSEISFNRITSLSPSFVSDFRQDPNRDISGGYLHRFVYIYELTEDLEQNLAHGYSLGPLLSTPNEVASASIETLQQESKSIISPFIDIYTSQRDLIIKRVNACRFNSNIASQFKASTATIQFWQLLAVCLEILPLPINSSGLVSWYESSLGHKLFQRLVDSMLKSKDCVTFAAAVCVLGGSHRVRRLYESGFINNTSSLTVVLDTDRNSTLTSNSTIFDQLELRMESTLLSYADLLHQWCALNKAVEVRKHFSPNTLLTLERQAQPKEFENITNQSFDDKAPVEYRPLKSMNYLESTRLDVDIYCSRCGNEAFFRTQFDSIRSRDSESLSTSSQPVQSRKSPKATKSKSIVNINSTMSSLSNANRRSSFSTPSVNLQQKHGNGGISSDSCGAGENIESLIWCQQCRFYGIECSLCQLPIKGQVYSCMLCGHGGHQDHIRAWFNDAAECPTGCGCRCIDDLFELKGEKYSYYDNSNNLPDAASSVEIGGNDDVGYGFGDTDDFMGDFYYSNAGLNVYGDKLKRGSRQGSENYNYGRNMDDSNSEDMIIDANDDFDYDTYDDSDENYSRNNISSIYFKMGSGGYSKNKNTIKLADSDGSDASGEEMSEDEFDDEVT